MSELRQRRGAQEREDTKETGAFANHAAGDAALVEPIDDADSIPQQQGLTLFGRVMLFAGFPICAGGAGLYVGYLKTMGDPDKTVDFDNDFVFPFLLALAMVLVVGFQTGGFTSKSAKPLVAWPKVRRKKKVIYKRVIVDDEDEDEKED